MAEDILIPYEWIELANQRWLALNEEGFEPSGPCRAGVDVAGMGRDESVVCRRYDNFVPSFERHQSAGKADHMHVAGMITKILQNDGSIAFIDTIGEGAGVYSRLCELGYSNAVSCKYSEGAKDHHDITGQHEFANMRAYLFWCVRDWLNPKNKMNPALPPNDKFAEEATEIRWKFVSDGRIIIEPKEDIKKRIGRSPDDFDALANTFYPQSSESYLSDADIEDDFS